MESHNNENRTVIPQLFMLNCGISNTTGTISNCSPVHSVPPLVPVPTPSTIATTQSTRTPVPTQSATAYTQSTPVLTQSARIPIQNAPVPTHNTPAPIPTLSAAVRTLSTQVPVPAQSVPAHTHSTGVRAYSTLGLTHVPAPTQSAPAPTHSTAVPAYSTPGSTLLPAPTHSAPLPVQGTPALEPTHQNSFNMYGTAGVKPTTGKSNTTASWHYGKAKNRNVLWYSGKAVNRTVPWYSGTAVNRTVPWYSFRAQISTANLAVPRSKRPTTIANFAPKVSCINAAGAIRQSGPSPKKPHAFLLTTVPANVATHLLNSPRGIINASQFLAGSQRVITSNPLVSGAVRANAVNVLLTNNKLRENRSNLLVLNIPRTNCTTAAAGINATKPIFNKIQPDSLANSSVDVTTNFSAPARLPECNIERPPVIIKDEQDVIGTSMLSNLTTHKSDTCMSDSSERSTLFSTRTNTSHLLHYDTNIVIKDEPTEIKPLIGRDGKISSSEPPIVILDDSFPVHKTEVKGNDEKISSSEPPIVILDDSFPVHKTEVKDEDDKHNLHKPGDSLLVGSNAYILLTDRAPINNDINKSKVDTQLKSSLTSKYVAKIGDRLLTKEELFGSPENQIRWLGQIGDESVAKSEVLARLSKRLSKRSNAHNRETNTTIIHNDVTNSKADTQTAAINKINTAMSNYVGNRFITKEELCAQSGRIRTIMQAEVGIRTILQAEVEQIIENAKQCQRESVLQSSNPDESVLQQNKSKKTLDKYGDNDIVAKFGDMFVTKAEFFGDHQKLFPKPPPKSRRRKKDTIEVIESKKESKWRTCEICQASFPIGRLYHEHKRKYHTEKKDGSCQYCGQTFNTTEVIFNEHVYKCAKKNNIKTEVKKRVALKLLYRTFCDICHKYFSCRTSLFNHMKNYHTEQLNFVCENCGKSFKTRPRIFHDHVARCGQNRNEKMGYNCTICSKSFASNKSLSVHRVRHRGPKYLCEICGITYMEKSSHDLHMAQVHGSPSNSNGDLSKDDSHKKHTKDESYKKHMCHHCGKRFYDKTVLKGHIRVHTGEEPYKCKQCGKGFKLAQGIRRHMYMHMHVGDKKYLCAICGKRFLTNRGLQSHVPVHNRVKPSQKESLQNCSRIQPKQDSFECNKCERKFNHKYKQLLHVKTCHGPSLKHGRGQIWETLKKRRKIQGKVRDMRFFCDTCGVGFMYRCMLRRHVIRHDESFKAFSCNGCAREFYTKRERDVHQMYHNPANFVFECDICFKKFVVKGLMHKHKRDVHLVTLPL